LSPKTLPRAKNITTEYPGNSQGLAIGPRQAEPFASAMIFLLSPYNK